MSKLPRYILGVSAYFHDSAAALVKDGKVVVAIQEERLSRIKQDAALPVKAIELCLEQEGINISEVDKIAYFEKPFLKFERLLETQIGQYPYTFLPFRKTVKSWLREKLWVPHNLTKATGYKGAFFYAEHHESHAAAACFSSPFDESAFLTIDGVGEWACASYGIYEDNKLTILAEQKYPHSVGMLYSAFTQYCGFKVNSGEYKLMGLAPYGKPEYAELIKENLVTIREDGSVELNLTYFKFHRGLRMINRRFEELFGMNARKEESKMEQFYMDIASSIQEVLEEIVLASATHIRKVTGKKNLCYSGGVALNCKANQKLAEAKIFDDVHIYSASGDAGGAIGAALLAANQSSKRAIQSIPSYLGKVFSNDEILETLAGNAVNYESHEQSILLEKTSKLLADGKVIGWFQGKDEMGPRALGNRSILASPMNDEMRDVVNMKIKFREQFRPFAPVIMEEFANEYFNNVHNANEMLYTFTCHQSTKIPACVHKDNSARVQTVNSIQNKPLYDLIKKFSSLTGVPVLINTSFNRRGEPMVHSPFDALRTFFGSGIDYLVMNNYIISKVENEHVNIKDITRELD